MHEQQIHARNAGHHTSNMTMESTEKMLKKSGQNQWTKNIQLTFWIQLWLIIIGLIKGDGPRPVLRSFRSSALF